MLWHLAKAGIGYVVLGMYRVKNMQKKPNKQTKTNKTKKNVVKGFFFQICLIVSILICFHILTLFKKLLSENGMDIFCKPFRIRSY